MKLTDIGPLQSDQLIKALCNTLLHSLWQGVILAIIAGLIVVFTKKASAARRYNLLTGALMLFAFGVAVTFIRELQKPAHSVNLGIAYIPDSNVGKAITYANSSPNTHFVVSPSLIANPGAPAVRQPAKDAIIQTVTGYLNTHYNLIVLVWFLIICARSIQMGVGVYGIYQLKRSKLSPAGAFWTNRLAQLTETLQLKQAVRLMESGLAKVPMVVGHLKPLILVPVGLVNALSTEEVEAILLHELAHIRRRDYLINFLQSFMEVIFFFNPAVLWLSQLMRAERENCCDDIAVAQTNSRFNYMNALVNCHEFQWQSPAYGMAFAGNKGNLVDRVKRMVSNSNQSLNMFEKTILAVCLVMLGLGVSAFSARKQITKTIHSVVAAISHEVKISPKPQVKTAETDTAKKKPATAVNDANAVVNQVQQLAPDTLKNNGTALDALTHTADSLRMNPASFSNSSLTDTIRRAGGKGTVMHDLGQELYRERLITDTDHLNISLNERELIVNGVRMPEDVHARIYSQFGRKEADANYRGNYRGRYPYNYVPSDGPEPTGVIIPDFGDTLIKYGVIKDKRHIHAIFNSHGLIINGVKQPDDVFRMLFKKYGENTNITYTNNGSPDPHMEQQAYWTRQQSKLIDQMAREGLITDRNDISFTLTTKTFVINGLVQPGEVFERYRQEYVPADAGDNWNWNYHNIPGDYSAYGNRYRNSGAYYQAKGEERRRLEADRDKNLVADLMQDSLITDPNNVSFSLTDKKLTINGKTQSAGIYQKYKDKYEPNSSGTNWSWNYSHHE